MFVRLTQKGNKWTIGISFQFSQEIAKRVSTLPRAWWNHEEREWQVPYTAYALFLTKKMFPDAVFDNEATDALAFIEHKKRIRQQAQTGEACGDAPKLKNINLFAYQQGGSHFLKEAGNALLADEVGCGKTAAAIAAAVDYEPVLIICPSSVKGFWSEKIEEYTEKQPLVINGQKAKPLPHHQWVIINWDLLSYHEKQLSEYGFTTIIGDELHRVKGLESKKTKVFLRLATAIPRVIGLSGTIIKNRPIELFPALVATKQLSIDDKVFFGRRYCNGHLKKIFIPGGRGRSRQVWDFSGSSNLEELREFLDSVLLRRTKAQVQSQLPPVLTSSITVDLDNMKLYRETEQEIERWLIEENGKAQKQQTKMVRYNALRRVSAMGKAAHIKEKLTDLLESGKKAIVFSSFLDPLYKMREWFPQSILIEGAASDRKRTIEIERFQTDPECRLAICSMGAGSEGITLTEAEALFFLDLPWAPSDLTQATARPNRVGQKGTINVYYYLGKGTIDQIMLDYLTAKASTIETILEAGAAQLQLLEAIERKLLS